MGKTSSTLFAAAIVLFVLTRCYIAFVLTPWITDVTLYFDYSARVIDRNRTPYRDFAIEYPPVAWWSICAAANRRASADVRPLFAGQRVDPPRLPSGVSA